MTSSIAIRAISAEATITIRWSILRPGYPKETAIFPGDDAAGTRHFGVFLDEELVGVASLYEAQLPENPGTGPTVQLRGMATLPKVRGTGCGRALLAGCVEAASRMGCVLLWCNARKTAVEFYRKHGWKVCSDEFEIPTVGPHYRMGLAVPTAQRLRRKK
jgi:GNAT superfamily N-acetyltransferase